MDTTGRRARWAGLGLAAMLLAFSVQAQQPYYAAYHMPFGSSSTSGFSGGFRLADFAGSNRVIAPSSYSGKGGSSSWSELWDISNPAQPAVLTSSSIYVRDVDSAGNILSTSRNDPMQFSLGSAGLGGNGFEATSVNDQGVVVGKNNSVGHWYNVHTGAGGQFEPVANFRVKGINNNGLVIGKGSSASFLYDINNGQSTVSSADYDFMAINNANQLLVNVRSGTSSQLYLQNDPLAAVGSGLNLSALPGAPTLSFENFDGVRMNNHGQVIVGSSFFDGNQWLDMQTYFGPQKGQLTLLAISDSAEILAQFAPTMPAGSFYRDITTSYVFKPSDTYVAARFVPEPASMALMGLGLAGVAWAVRRQRTGLPARG